MAKKAIFRSVGQTPSPHFSPPDGRSRVAAGMPVARRPPHRSVRERQLIRLLPWKGNGKAHTWKPVTATWPRHMHLQQPVKPAPAYPAFLAAPPQPRPPVPGQRPAKTRQLPPVSRHAPVLKVASHHRPQPLAGLARRRLHPRPQLALNLRQLRPHPLTGTVLRRTTKCPLFALISQICVNPRKPQVSGLPSPRPRPLG